MKYRRFNVNPLSIRSKNEDTCYVFGDGSSLKFFELKAFNNFPSISCGNLYLRKDFNDLDTRLISCIEPYYFWPSFLQKHQYLKEFKYLASAHREYIKEQQGINFVINLSNFPFIRSKNISYMHRCILHKDKIIRKILKVTDPLSGSFYTQILLAYLIGFKKIYLVGFDSWVLDVSSSNRWYEYGLGEKLPITNYGEDFLKIILSVMEIKIISVNENNHPFINSIKYESHTGNKPIYRENHELTSVPNLNLLRTYPAYNI